MNQFFRVFSLIALLSFSGMSSANVLYYFSFDSEDEQLFGSVALDLSAWSGIDTGFVNGFESITATSSILGDVGHNIDYMVFSGWDLSDNDKNMVGQLASPIIATFFVEGSGFEHLYGSNLISPRSSDYLRLTYLSTVARSVPEPSILALMGLGLVGMFGVNRRKLRA